jgi:hypothetical protein
MAVEIIREAGARQAAETENVDAPARDTDLGPRVERRDHARGPRGERPGVGVAHAVEVDEREVRGGDECDTESIKELGSEHLDFADVAFVAPLRRVGV